MPSRLRNDLNGLRVRLPGTDPIYLIDEGKRRYIDNPETYAALFSTEEGVIEDIVPSINNPFAPLQWR